MIADSKYIGEGGDKRETRLTLKCSGEEVYMNCLVSRNDLKVAIESGIEPGFFKLCSRVVG